MGSWCCCSGGRRFDHLVAIAGEFHKLAEEAQGITRAVVRTAVPITAARRRP